jgi:hypothetical protein
MSRFRAIWLSIFNWRKFKRIENGRIQGAITQTRRECFEDAQRKLQMLKQEQWEKGLALRVPGRSIELVQVPEIGLDEMGPMAGLAMETIGPQVTMKKVEPLQMATSYMKPEFTDMLLNRTANELGRKLVELGFVRAVLNEDMRSFKLIVDVFGYEE